MKAWFPLAPLNVFVWLSLKVTGAMATRCFSDRSMMISSLIEEKTTSKWRWTFNKWFQKSASVNNYSQSFKTQSTYQMEEMTGTFLYTYSNWCQRKVKTGWWTKRKCLTLTGFCFLVFLCSTYFVCACGSCGAYYHQDKKMKSEMKQQARSHNPRGLSS